MINIKQYQLIITAIVTVVFLFGSYTNQIDGHNLLEMKALR
jgi:hypothetical protein